MCTEMKSQLWPCPHPQQGVSWLLNACWIEDLTAIWSQMWSCKLTQSLADAFVGVCRRLVVTARLPWRKRALPEARGAEKTCAWRRWGGAPGLSGTSRSQGGGWALAKPEASKTGLGQPPRVPEYRAPRGAGEARKQRDPAFRPSSSSPPSAPRGVRGVRGGAHASGLVTTPP